MYEAFRDYIFNAGVSEWRITGTGLYLPLVNNPDPDPGSGRNGFHIHYDDTAQLLESHTHLFIMLFPIPFHGGDTDADTPVLAPFAARHYYRDVISFMKKAFTFLYEEAGITARDIRLFSNSRFPEKQFAALAGLGSIGKNNLLLNKKLGSSFIIAGAAIKAQKPGLENLKGPVQENLPSCGTCTRCIDACPAGALDPQNGFIRQRCLQYLATQEEPWDEAVSERWGRRLYGCMVCQEVCPWNSTSPEIPGSQKKPIYTPPSYSRILSAFCENLALPGIFGATALEASWIPRSAILRNTITAAANAPLSPSELEKVALLLPALFEHGSAEVRQAVRWFWKQKGRQNP